MKQNIHQNTDNIFVPMTSMSAGSLHHVKRGIPYYTNQIVNVVFVKNYNFTEWVLIDAGMPHSGEKIIKEAAKIFPDNPRPVAIILTHGHFDHVGGIVKLIEEWKVPVYAHPLEFPYLTGQRDYPEPDTSVEGGLLAKISSIYPHKSINIEEYLLPLPEDGCVPDLPGWKWLHTPGHSPGHVSFFRPYDKTLIAGDAFITVRADSFYKVLIQKKEINGPPRYLTTDWQEAWKSVKKLEDLKPALAITGHGQAMEGKELEQGLSRLVKEFEDLAIPDYGKFIK